MRLRTFGGLWIDGAPASPALGPRQLALLALVAAAGKKGITRERLIGILWPETGEEQARHTLSQTLYSLRREAGRDLITGTTQLRLDPSLASDLGEFRAALAAGDLETGAGLYTGPFLDGFYLPGTEEFERWVEEERRAVAKEAVRAMERLATQAEEAGRHADAAHWWHRLGELDPLSARYAAGELRGLSATGDRTGALARARSYREMVHRELGAEPDPAIQRLEASLRAVPPPAAVSATAAPSVQSPSPAPPAQPAIKTRRSWLIPAVGIAVVAIGLAASGALSKSSGDLPFLAVGEIRVESSSDTTPTGRILRDMLSTSLGAIEGLQVVANSRLVELMPRGPNPAPGAVTDAARRAGATEVIEGELAVEPGLLSLSLRRVAVGRGVVRKGYVVRAADRSALVDSASAAIARDLGIQPPSGSVATMRTASASAYALYEQGIRAYYQYDAPAAYRLMRAALEEDSNFAMAAYYGWSASLRTVTSPEGDAELLRLAQQLAPRAIDRERLLIVGSVSSVTAPLPTAVAIAETLAVRYPNDPDGQILLGRAYTAAGEWPAAIASFERAVAMDSAAGVRAGSLCRLCTTLSLASEVYLWWDSAAAAERTARRLIALRPDVESWGALVLPLLRQGRRAEAAAVLSSVPRPTFQRDMIRLGQFEEVDRELLADLQSHLVNVRAEGRWLLLISLRNQGRLQEAMALARDQVIPGSSQRVDLPVEGTNIAILPMESGRPLEAAKVYRSILASHLTHGWSTGFKARYGTWMLALAGTALAAAGDTAGVRRIADSAEQMGSLSNWARDPRLHHFLRGLLWQRKGRHEEAVSAFRRALVSTTDGFTRINLELARSLLALDSAKAAVAILQPALRGGVDGSNTYVTHTELHEALARAFEMAGQADSAKAHWRAVESAWRRADPQFRDRYQRAKLRSEGQR